MSKLEDDMIEQEIKDYWLNQGEAVMREMLEDEDEDGVDKNVTT